MNNQSTTPEGLAVLEAYGDDNVTEGFGDVKIPAKRKPGRPRKDGLESGSPEAEEAKASVKKPGIKMDRFVEDLGSLTNLERINIYRAALDYGADKRNFCSEYYIIAKYGIPQNEIDKWKRDIPLVSRLASVDRDRLKAELLDRAPDQYGGLNFLGAQFILKAMYGLDDRADTSKIPIDVDIEIGFDMGTDDIEDTSNAYDDMDDAGVAIGDISET